MPQIAEVLSRQLGHSVAYTHRSAAEQHKALIAENLSPFVAELLVGLDTIFCHSVLTERTFTVEALTGTPPRSITDWLLENLDVFKQQR
ncbi:hypothetical protein [Pseudomonas syringae]|nr:hypothetical protein [Pseudomonas syringae]